MKKIFLIMIFIVLLSTIANCSDFQLRQGYSGDIVMLYPDPSGGYYKYCNLIYTPKSNKFLYVNRGVGYSHVFFSEDKGKILGLDGDCLIVEYDLKTNSSITVFKGDEVTEASYDYVKYVPKSDCISFIAYPNIWIYNRKTKERKVVTQGYGDYSWSKDGKILYYNKINENKVYYLSMENKESTLYIEDGFSPQLSPSNNFIAFLKEDGKLVVREIKTGKEWFYKSLEVYYYKFSPDDKYLAIMELTPKDKLFNKTSLTGWDFKNNQKIALISDLPEKAYSNFDWK